MEQGIPLCPPNYTKNWKVRDLLGTSDPKYEKSAINIQGLRPLTARVQFNKYREIRMVGYNGKRIRHQDLPFSGVYESYSKTKTQNDVIREQLSETLHHAP